MEYALYNIIGNNYNATRTADPFIAQTLYELLVSNKDGLYMDIGCGTGNYTLAMAGKGLRVCGADPSQKMLEIARKRDSCIEWVLAGAEVLPMDDSQFSGIFGMLTLHHWKDISKSFRELYRVLEDEGNVAFFTSTPAQMEGYWLNHYFPRMLAESIRQMPSFEKINDAALQAGFEVMPPEKYFISDDLKDHFLYVGKNRPELYFDENIRHGISSFAALANKEEVGKGLAALSKDIADGSFTRIKDKYNTTEGDYLFVQLRK